MITRPIGECFFYKKVELQVVHAFGCFGCYFHRKHKMCHRDDNITGECLNLNRNDNKSVIFKEVSK